MEMICKYAQLVFDTRNATKGCGRDHIVMLGNGWQLVFECESGGRGLLCLKISSRYSAFLSLVAMASYK